MTANELTFGIEIECFIPNEHRAAIQLGGYHRGIQIRGLPAGWNAQHDGSLQSGPSGYFGVEVVSPIMKGADGMQQVKVVCEWLKQIGAKVAKCCGFHVHVGFDRTNVAAMKRLVHNVANFEKAIYAATGTKSREQNHYCRTVQNDQAFRNGSYARTDRYHVLNVTNLIANLKPTVEFRAFAGTTNFIKIVGYIRLSLALVEKAMTMKKQTNWKAKTPVETSPIHRKGEGQTELCRLFYFLGWTKGRTNYTFGDVQADNCPSIIDCKKELMRLAKKYDERND